MNLEETIEAVSREKYTILGYVNSAGLVCDLKVQHLEFDENYTHLVRRAVGVLDRLKRPDHILPETWDVAVRQQTDSWLKHLHDNGDKLLSSAVAYDRSYYQLIDTTDPSKGIHIFAVFCEKHYRDGEPSGAKAPVPIAKEWIKEQTELKDYVSKLILAPGKFEKVTYEV